jgi:hypothetical protein
MQELLQLRDNGQLDRVQMQWFRNSKPKEELFDLSNDPHELNNMANDPKYQDKLVELRSEMDRWLQDIEDQPNLPERELISQLWEGNSVQPSTAEPEIEFSERKIVITCATKGATVGYKIITESSAIPATWSIYSEPIEIKEFGKLLLQAHRIGFVPSKTLEFDVGEKL